MIKSFTVTNYLGDALTMELTNPEESGFIIKSVTGLGPGKTTLNIKEIASNDGGYFAGSRTPVKNIVINLQFIGTPLIEDTRHKSYKYFPVKKPLKLSVLTDRYELEISGYVESNEPDIFSKDEGCQISILCPLPYFTTTKKQIVQTNGDYAMFEFPFSNELIKNPVLEEEYAVNLMSMSRNSYSEEPPHEPDTLASLVFTWSPDEAPFNPTKYPYFVNQTTVIKKYLSLTWPDKLIKTLKNGEYYILQFTLDMRCYANDLTDGYNSKMCKFGGVRYLSNGNLSNPSFSYMPLLNTDGIPVNPQDYISRYTSSSIFPSDLSSYAARDFVSGGQPEFGGNTATTVKVNNENFMVKITNEILNTFNTAPMEFTAEYYNGTYNNATDSFTWVVDNEPGPPLDLIEGDFGMRDQFSKGGYINGITNVKCWLISPIVEDPDDPNPTKPNEYLVDETLPDEWIEIDDDLYNYRISKGIIFGNLNNYQFEHVIDYEGTKDVGFVMTIEFENSLALTEWDGQMDSAGYIVIKDTKYISESIVINLDKIKELLPKATAYTVVGDMEYEVDPGELNVIPPIAQKGDVLTIDTRSGNKSAYYQKTELWSYTVVKSSSDSLGGGVSSPPSETPLIPNQKVKWQPSYEQDQTEYIKRQFNVLAAVNREASWFSLSQGTNTLVIRHTFHPDLEDLQSSDKNLVRANLLMVQTENSVYFEGI